MLDAGLGGERRTRSCLGPTEEIPYLKAQERLTFARCGVTDPLSLADYEAHGGFRGLRRALRWLPRRSSKRWSRPGCAAAAARAFPPASSGAPF